MWFSPPTQTPPKKNNGLYCTRFVLCLAIWAPIQVKQWCHWCPAVRRTDVLENAWHSSCWRLILLTHRPGSDWIGSQQRLPNQSHSLGLGTQSLVLPYRRPRRPQSCARSRIIWSLLPRGIKPHCPLPRHILLPSGHFQQDWNLLFPRPGKTWWRAIIYSLAWFLSAECCSPLAAFLSYPSFSFPLPVASGEGAATGQFDLLRLSSPISRW